MAAFSLVHGAWHGSWAWDILRRELGRSYYPDSADAVRELQYPFDAAALARLLRPQAPSTR